MLFALTTLKKLYWVPLAVACLVVTRPFFFADTVDFAAHIVGKEHGASVPFLEFGHLWWRPIGYLVDLTIGGPLSPYAPPSDRGRVSLILILVSLLAYALATITFYLLCRTITHSDRAAAIGTLLLACSAPLLNYSRAGAPYMFGVTLVIAAFYFALRRQEPPLSDLLFAGLFASLACAAWLLFIWSVPAIVVSRPLLLQRRLADCRRAVAIAASFTIAILCIYAHAVISLHLFSIGAISGWRTHGPDIPLVLGFQRMLFGLPKTLLYLGNEGLAIKRFATHDPFNPVSFVELASGILWKLGVFVAVFAALIVLLWRIQDGGRKLLFLLIGLLPNLAFAIRFNGADPERFMPFLPVLVLCLTLVFDHGSAALRTAFYCIAILVISVNVGGMWYQKYYHEERRLEQELAFANAFPKTLIVVPNMQDRVHVFLRDHPLHELSWSNRIGIYEAVSVERDTRQNWLQHLRAFARDSLSPGVPVWISSELTSQTPPRSMYWIERSSPMPWVAVKTYFSNLHYFDSASGYRRVSPLELAQ